MRQHCLSPKLQIKSGRCRTNFFDILLSYGLLKRVVVQHLGEEHIGTSPTERTALAEGVELNSFIYSSLASYKTKLVRDDEYLNVRHICLSNPKLAVHSSTSYMSIFSSLQWVDAVLGYTKQYSGMRDIQRFLLHLNTSTALLNLLQVLYHARCPD
jgi:hypothetical protein